MYVQRNRGLITNKRSGRSASPLPNRGRVVVLGGFQFLDDESSVALSGAAQRLLALLALRDRGIRRLTAAVALWPEASEEHALASLRTSLTRLNTASREAVRTDSTDIQLAEDVTVDIRESRALAQRILTADGAPAPADCTPESVLALSADVLPDWYEDWVTVETAEWRQIRVRALDVVANHLARQHRFEEAVSAALAAIKAEPLREASQATLIHIQLAQGHDIEAAAIVTRYGALLQQELGVDSPPMLSDLLRFLPAVRTDMNKSRATTVVDEGANVLRRAQTAVAGEDTAEFEVVATGLSMEPSIRHGDTLLVGRDIAPTPGRIAVAIHDGTWIVKRVAERDGGLVLRSDNADEEVALSAVQFQGVVVELRRTL